jgi:cystathionine beta-lyase
MNNPTRIFQVLRFQGIFSLSNSLGKELTRIPYIGQLLTVPFYSRSLTIANMDQSTEVDFNQVLDRRHTQSLKWDGMQILFPATDLLPMWVADMDFASPPCVLQALQRKVAHGVFGYPFRPHSLFTAVASWLENRHRWAIETEWLIFAPGVMTSLATALLAYTEVGDRVLIQSPVYYPFFQVLERNGRMLVDNALRLDGECYRIDFADLDQKLPGTSMMIFCSPHNPVGRVWRREELVEVARLCAKHDVLLFSDEIHCDLVLSGNHHIPTASLANAACRTITCMAPSKTFNLAGLSTSFCVIPDAVLRAKFRQTGRALFLDMPNLLGIAATEAAYRDGGPWLDQLLSYLEGNLHTIELFLAKRLPGVQLISPEATYLAWLDFRLLGQNQQELNQTLVEAKVALDDGMLFGPGGEGFQRLNFGCPRTLLQEGLQRVAKAVKGAISR